jgi:hypothetical protein
VSAANTPSSLEAVRRFRDILALVSREPVRTAYEVASRLGLPVSSTYLAVAEMERLSCLARDEAGFLLVGARPQQMALDALGFPVAAQRLAPLVRYLRDQTGETVFMAHWTEMLSVGTTAIGFNPGSLVVEPFQAYRLAAPSPARPPDGVFPLTLFADGPLGAATTAVDLLAVRLARSRSSSRPGLLLVGVARAAGEFADTAYLSRELVETKAYFDRSRT